MRASDGKQGASNEFQFQLVRLKSNMPTPSIFTTKVSIPTGSIKINYDEFAYKFKVLVSIPTGSIKIVRSTNT